MSAANVELSGESSTLIDEDLIATRRDVFDCVPLTPGPSPAKGRGVRGEGESPLDMAAEIVRRICCQHRPQKFDCLAPRLPRLVAVPAQFDLQQAAVVDFQ